MSAVQLRASFFNTKMKTKSPTLMITFSILNINDQYIYEYSEFELMRNIILMFYLLCIGIEMWLIQNE